MSDEYDRARELMVKRQIAARGIGDDRVLDAMREVPREAFVGARDAREAYGDHPVPIGFGQTISQPFIVAEMMAQLGLRDGDRVLEVGSGSGYAAAVMSRVADEVFAVERVPELVERARETLASLGYDNVHVFEADGTLGLPDHAPFDAIAVAAAGPRVPDALAEQLAIGGRLVMPVGERTNTQQLVRIERVGPNHYERSYLGPVRFVPLIGAEGFDDDR